MHVFVYIQWDQRWQLCQRHCHVVCQSNDTTAIHKFVTILSFFIYFRATTTRSSACLFWCIKFLLSLHSYAIQNQFAIEQVKILMNILNAWKAFLRIIHSIVVSIALNFIHKIQCIFVFVSFSCFPSYSNRLLSAQDYRRMVKTVLPVAQMHHRQAQYEIPK